jgi:hypothetical protein
MADLPSRIDRATFDRILQRAAELQASSKDIGEGLSEEEILALGTEVGIPASHLQQALLEERTRVALPAANGLLDRWVGPADFVAQRVVQGTPETIGAALTKWLERQEHLVVQRGTLTRITYEPMEGFASAMRSLSRAFDAKRGKPFLDKADPVTAVITPLEAGFCHVTLAASLRKTRSAHVMGGSAIAVVGGGMGLPVLAFYPNVLIAVGVAAVASALGLVVARTFRPRAGRVQTGLERALDELERRPALPPGQQPQPVRMGQMIQGIANEVRKALEDGK